jgi:hypothetical protein
MLTPLGVLRESHIGSGGKPGPGQRLGVLDKQVGRRPAVRSRTEVRLHAEMNLRAIEGNEAVSAAAPLAGTETKAAVIGKGSGQVTNGEDRRYSRTHDCNLSRPARAVQGSARSGRVRVRPPAEDAALDELITRAMDTVQRAPWPPGPTHQTARAHQKCIVLT